MTILLFEFLSPALENHCRNMFFSLQFQLGNARPHPVVIVQDLQDAIFTGILYGPSVSRWGHIGKHGVAADVIVPDPVTVNYRPLLDCGRADI